MTDDRSAFTEAQPPCMCWHHVGKYECPVHPWRDHEAEGGNCRNCGSSEGEIRHGLVPANCARPKVPTLSGDRREFREARSAGKAIHHEQRLENATYTAVEVKALTKTASDFAYALGRKETAEEIAVKVEGGRHADCALPFVGACDTCWALDSAARIAREIGTKENS